MSGKPVEFYPEALAEAEAAVAWYRERSLRAAEVFVSDLEKAIAAISEAPRRIPGPGPLGVHSELRGIPKWKSQFRLTASANRLGWLF
jgi:plasmid stabilization system protein ParE